MDTLYEELHALFLTISTVISHMFLGATQVWTDTVEKNESPVHFLDG
jgi:succinate dehydrogenase hydrophobic anchor subunit